VTIVKQLCLHDFDLFKSIHPIEYLNAIWKAKKSDDEDAEDNTPNLDFFISRFDKVIINTINTFFPTLYLILIYIIQIEYIEYI